MSWIYIGAFSIVVAVVLVQLFKYFVTAPEIAAQDAATKRKSSAKKPQGSSSKPPKAQKSTDNTPKIPDTSSSSSSTQELSVTPKQEKRSIPPAPVQTQADIPKDNKPAKENKPPKATKEPKIKLNSDLKASSGNESTDPEKTGKKKDKGKKPETEKKPKTEKKKKNELATETTDEEFARQWAADYQPTSSNKNEPVATIPQEAWRQVGSADSQIEEYKKKLQALEKELEISRETNKATHEKHQEALSRANRALQSAEQQHKEASARFQRELELVKESGMGINDSLSSKNYSKAERAEKPRTALKGLIADEQKEREKGKEKEREERERQDKHKEEREKQDRERDERDKHDRERERQDRDTQSAVFKQKFTELESKYKEVAEQLKATEAVNNFLTASLAAQSREVASAAPSTASNDQSTALNKKIEELTAQLSKKEREAEDKIKAVTAQLKERESGFKVAEETHKQSLTDANSHVEKLRSQLTALEASSAKGSGNEEIIKQLQQSLQEEKEKTDAAQQQSELAEAAKVSYKGKLEEAQKTTAEFQSKLDALKKSHEAAEAETTKAHKSVKTLESELAAAVAAKESAHGELTLKHAQQLEGEQQRVKDLEAALATEKAAHQAAKHAHETEKANASSSQASVEDARSQVADAQRSAEEANKRTQEATMRAEDAARRVDEAAKTIQELNSELANLKRKLEESDGSKVDQSALEQKHKEELEIVEAKLTEEKAARVEVVNRLEELSTRVKELESQPQAGGSAGLKLNINSPNRIAPDASTEQQ